MTSVGEGELKALSLCIGIPTHGFSDELNRLLKFLNSSTNPVVRDATLLISNSGDSYDLSDYYEGEFVYSEVDQSNYWTGSVAEVYRLFFNKNSSHLLLMNHDCVPEVGCLEHLFEYVRNHSNVIVHPAVCYQHKKDTVFWAGCIEQYASRFKSVYMDVKLKELRSDPYDVAAMVGQCLLIPREAINISFLHQDKFPHYFSDYVQSVLMRRQGYALRILPQAIAYSDRSDLDFKRKRQRCTSLKGLWTSWTAPYSSRYLKGVFLAPYYTQSRLSGAFFLSFIVTLGTMVKSVLEVIRFRDPV